MGGASQSFSDLAVETLSVSKAASVPGLSLRAFTPGTSVVGSDVWIQNAGFQPNSGASGNFAPALNQLVAVPFLPGPGGGFFNAMAFDQIVAAGAGGLARVGMFNHNPATGQPGQQIVDCGQIATDGANGVKVLPSNFMLPPTLFWGVILFGVAAPTIAGFGAAVMTETLLGYAAGVPNNTQVGWNVAFAFGALPLSWPGGATIRVVSAGIPYVAARLA